MLGATTLAQRRSYSITSSANIKSDGGSVRPSALAIFRLMTRSNFVTCATGRSAIENAFYEICRPRKRPSLRQPI